MPTLQELCLAIEDKFPLHYQEEWDNSGLQCGNRGQTVTDVLVALEVTPAVLNEAIALGCQAIVTHHPILFRPPKCISDDEEVTRMLRIAIRHDIAIYSAHTTIDNAPNGINKLLADKLGLLESRILCPLQAHPEAGGGIAARLPQALTAGQLVELTKQRLNVQQIIFGGDTNKLVTTVGICSGAGAFMAAEATAQQLDAFITSDIKHHDYRDAENKILLIDAGHYETEIFIKQILFDVISQKNRNFALHIANSEVPPRYFK
ncbi:MAG: Nif3-like dinuclear metal center hexameric protein [Paludibacteraceae bacterium]|nr:Nif3-like dinuclear metal center hexameric protein [Paludibacteraceae bacterium]